MEDHQKRRRTENIANRRLFRRTLILMVMCGIVMFIPVIGKLWNLQIIRHDELEQMAVDQQTGTLAITAARGTIYDSNNNVLAISSTAYDIIISPKAISDRQEKLDKALAEAKEKGKPYAEYDVNVEDLVVTGMSQILGLDPAELREKCKDTTKQYKRLAQKVDTETEDAVRAYIDEHELAGCIYLQPNTKRYYPYSTLASQIIGFTNANGGAYGLEATFDEQLTGTDGLVVTAQNASGTDLLNFFQDYYDARHGDDLHLTLDANIQSMCESALKEGIERNEVLNGGFIIVMDCDTGAVLGMASAPTYDLNNYSTVLDTSLLEALEDRAEEIMEADNTGEMTLETARSMAYSEALNSQWRNKAINDTYEPGSTFKAVVLAAALEEGVTNGGEHFFCSGSINVPGWPKPIYCSRVSGHESQSLATAVGNSCNPVFITLGQRLGMESFYSYLEAFGIVDSDSASAKTGIDLPGEGGSIVWDYESFNTVNLATASFGQRFTVTPIQLLTAVNTVINGGYYYQPYVVDYVEDSEGNITYSADPTPLRQVVSESTSKTCREMLEGVVANGLTGKNAYRAGYRIGGKTGTSETLVEGEYVVSFVGFAPADDPEVVVLVAFDNPHNVGTESYPVTPGGEYISGGNMAAPVAGDLLVDILDYLDYGKQFTAEELAGADTEVPGLVGCTVSYAKGLVEEKGFTLRVVGEGDDQSVIRYQTAKEGYYIPKGSELVAYIGEATPPDSVTVPDLTGMTPEQASRALYEAGLYMKATGSTRYFTDETRAYSQSVGGGEAVNPGKVITVSFNDTSETENETTVFD